MPSSSGPPVADDASAAGPAGSDDGVGAGVGGAEGAGAGCGAGAGAGFGARLARAQMASARARWRRARRAARRARARRVWLRWTRFRWEAAWALAVAFFAVVLAAAQAMALEVRAAAGEARNAAASRHASSVENVTRRAGMPSAWAHHAGGRTARPPAWTGGRGRRWTDVGGLQSSPLDGWSGTFRARRGAARRRPPAAARQWPAARRH